MIKGRRDFFNKSPAGLTQAWGELRAGQEVTALTSRMTIPKAAPPWVVLEGRALGLRARP